MFSVENPTFVLFTPTGLTSIVKISSVQMTKLSKSENAVINF